MAGTKKEQWNRRRYSWLGTNRRGDEDRKDKGQEVVERAVIFVENSLTAQQWGHAARTTPEIQAKDRKGACCSAMLDCQMDLWDRF